MQNCRILQNHVHCHRKALKKVVIETHEAAPEANQQWGRCSQSQCGSPWNKALTNVRWRCSNCLLSKTSHADCGVEKCSRPSSHCDTSLIFDITTWREHQGSNDVHPSPLMTLPSSHSCKHVLNCWGAILTLCPVHFVHSTPSSPATMWRMPSPPRLYWYHFGGKVRRFRIHVIDCYCKI